MQMNRGFLIVLIPAVMVAIGYIVVMRYAGVTPSYARLAAGTAVFFGGIWWLGQRHRNRRDSSSKDRPMENRTSLGSE